MPGSATGTGAASGRPRASRPRRGHAPRIRHHGLEAEPIHVAQRVPPGRHRPPCSPPPPKGDRSGADAPVISVHRGQASRPSTVKTMRSASAMASMICARMADRRSSVVPGSNPRCPHGGLPALEGHSAVQPIARDAGDVADERLPDGHEAVEEGGLAHVGRPTMAMIGRIMPAPPQAGRQSARAWAHGRDRHPSAVERSAR